MGSLYESVWSTNRSFAILGGKEILAFINIIPNVVDFLKSKFILTETLDALCCGILLWKNISQFIHRAQIMDIFKSESEQAKQKQDYEKTFCFQRCLKETL